MTDDLMTLAQVAERLQRPEATLRYWRHLGTGPHSFRLGKRVMYRQSDVSQWLDEMYREQVAGTAGDAA